MPAAPKQGPNNIHGTVLKVLPSPGAWSGTIQFLQWFDLKVCSSRVPDIPRDAVLHIGVPLVAGDQLFDQQRRELSKNKVFPGKLLSITLSEYCSNRREASSYIVEPKCIKVLK